MILKASSIGYSRAKKSILESISFSAEEGEFVGILGPNGSGKTTLIKILSGIIEDYSGTVKISGEDILDIDKKRMPGFISYVPQLPACPKGFMVKEIVEMGASGKEVRKAIVDAGLAGFEEREISTLSGGEFQRTVIARALAQQAKILLMDEPTSHLDIKHQLEILNIVKSIKGQTTVAAFHDITLAKMFCDRLILIKDGRKTGEGAPDQILSEANLSCLFDMDASLYSNFI